MLESLPGIRKAAVLLVQLGKEHSAKVLSQLRENEVEELSAEIVRLGVINPDTADRVMTEFHEMTTAHNYLAQGGMEYARELLEASLGKERATEICLRLAAAFVDKPFKFLQKADPRYVTSFLQDEHPQTIALVLAHVPAPNASIILSGFSGEVQADIANRIAGMDRTSPEIIRQVEQALERKLSSVLSTGEMSTVGGLQPLVDIINRADRVSERMILEGLAAINPELAEQVRSKMFMFEDIVGLEDKGIQLVLRQVETSDLATALKGVRDDVRDKVMHNLSERAAENLGEEIELLGTVRLRAVEEAQAKIVHVIRTLEESGQLLIRRADDDEFVS